MSSPKGEALNLVALPGSASSLLNPLRRRILEALRSPDSAAGLGRRLGLPRQKLNYHLRELEKRSLVEVVEERRRGNCLERILRAKADYFVIDPEALGGLSAQPEAIADRFSAAYLIALAGRTIRELAALTHKAREAGRRVATFTLDSEIHFASAADRNAFATELATEVARLAAKYHREGIPGGRRFRVLLASHPSGRKASTGAGGGRPHATGATDAPGPQKSPERADAAGAQAVPTEARAGEEPGIPTPNGDDEPPER